MAARSRPATQQRRPGESERAPGAPPDPFAVETEVGIFPTFFMAGFECSTFVWKDGERKDYVVRHRARPLPARTTTTAVEALGIGVVREASAGRWSTGATGATTGRRSSPVVDALGKHHLTADLGPLPLRLPGRLSTPSPRSASGASRDYCRAVAEYLRAARPAPHFFTPLNEITFFAAAGTDMGWMYPFAKGKYAEMKRALCRMAIEGVEGASARWTRAARMVHVDPIVHAVPPEDRPDLADEAWKQAYEEAYEAWDMLAGKTHPELGGAPEILDIVGVNVYHFSQAQMNADKSRAVLGPRDPRRKPLGEMLLFAWERYHRPLIIGETSGHQDQRAEWLRMTMEESLQALNSGVDLQGSASTPASTSRTGTAASSPGSGSTT